MMASSFEKELQLVLVPPHRDRSMNQITQSIAFFFLQSGVDKLLCMILILSRVETCCRRFLDFCFVDDVEVEVTRRNQLTSSIAVNGLLRTWMDGWILDTLLRHPRLSCRPSSSILAQELVRT